MNCQIIFGLQTLSSGFHVFIYRVYSTIVPFEAVKSALRMGVRCPPSSLNGQIGVIAKLSNSGSSLLFKEQMMRRKDERFTDDADRVAKDIKR